MASWEWLQEQVDEQLLGHHHSNSESLSEEDVLTFLAAPTEMYNPGSDNPNHNVGHENFFDACAKYPSRALFPPHVFVENCHCVDELKANEPPTLLDRLHMARNDEEYYKMLQDDLKNSSPGAPAQSASARRKASTIRKTGARMIVRLPARASTSSLRDQNIPLPPPKKSKSSTRAFASASSISAAIPRKRKLTERIISAPSLSLKQVHETAIRRELASDERRLKIIDEIIEIMSKVRTDVHVADMHMEWAIQNAKSEIEQRIKCCDEDVQKWIRKEREKERARGVRRRLKPATAQRAGMGLGQVSSRVVCMWCEESLSTKLVLADHVRAIHLDFHVSFCDKCNQYSSPRKYSPAHQCVGNKASKSTSCAV